jgi:hypothetical protein
MADEAAEFWSAFEKETGEKVEARAIGEYYKGQDLSIGLWGLVILTDKSFRFKHMPSENWMSTIFKRMDRSAKPKEPLELRFAREDILALNAPNRGFFAKLFGPAFPRFGLKVRSAPDAAQAGAAGEEEHLFSVDPSGGVLAALEKLLTSRQG